MPRRAKPALVQLFEGNPNNKVKKELNKRVKNEKSFNVGTDKLVPPAWLRGKAKEAFSTIVELYKDTTFLTNADVVTLSRYCDLYSEYLATNTRLQRQGRLINGKPNPDLQMKLKISAEMGKMEKELGLSPASRASLAIHLDGELEKAQKEQWDKEDDEFS